MLEILKPNHKEKTAEQLADEAKENQRKSQLQAFRNGLETCRKTISLLEVTQFQGRQFDDVAQCFYWLKNIEKHHEAEIKRLESER